jgi:hypothetical protein
MAGRGLRARAPVSYNEKNTNGEGMVPAWLKTIQPNVNDPPPEPKRRKKANAVAAKAKGSPNKENDDEPTTLAQGSTGATAGSVPSNQPANGKGKKMKKRTVATRGRNGGLRVEHYGTC